MILKEFGYKSPLPIDFTENNHCYKSEGIPLIGITTSIGQLHKDFMKFWTTKENYKFMMANWDVSKVYTKKEKEVLLFEAKNAWTKKSGKALDTGKIAHKMIQKSIEAGTREDPKKIKNEEVRSAYQAFIDWEKIHEIEYLATELIVGSKVHYTGGTIDAIAIVDGFLELLDWKTSSQLSITVFLQLGSYKMMLLEGGIEKIKRRVVRFPKDNKKFEELLVKSNYEKDIACFLSLLNSYRWERDIKKAFCDKRGKLLIK